MSKDVLRMKISGQNLDEQGCIENEDFRPEVKCRVRAMVIDRRASTHWLEDWIKPFKGVLYCAGPGHRDEVIKACNEDKTLQSKYFHRGRRGPYWLVGYFGETPVLKCFNRPFYLRPQRSNQSFGNPKN